MSHLKKLSSKMCIELDSLIEMLNTLAQIVTDVDFIQQSLAINDTIANLSRDN